MKNPLFLFLAVFMFASINTRAQNKDKSQRPSPPASVTQTLKSGAVITLNYSSPSLKGRTIGTDVEPKDGKVWRAGANEATTFEASKDVLVEGKSLAAGKYSLFMLKNGDDYTVIFNKATDIWGTQYEKNKDKDALQVHVKGKKNKPVADKLTYTIDKNGKVSLAWGDLLVTFAVK